MKATLPPIGSSVHAQGGSVASPYMTHSDIGPCRVNLADATCYNLAHLLALSFAPFVEKEAVTDEPFC